MPWGESLEGTFRRGSEHCVGVTPKQVELCYCRRASVVGSVAALEKLRGRAQRSVHHLLAGGAGTSVGIRKFKKQKVWKWDLAGMTES